MHCRRMFIMEDLKIYIIIYKKAKLELAGTVIFEKLLVDIFWEIL